MKVRFEPQMTSSSPDTTIAAATSIKAVSFVRFAPPTPVTYSSLLSSTIPFLDLRSGLDGEVESAIARVLASGSFLLGPELEAFEREFAEYCGTRHCVGVGSGLSALELTLRGAGIGPGDEVIVPAYTWVATWLAVTATGATPVRVDVRRET